MRELMENLLALQNLEMASRKAGKESERSLLRGLIPEPILAHFDRLLARGKKGVATVRQGVCSECHLRLPTGTLVTLARGDDIQICGNCGRYLYLPADELPGKPETKPAVTEAVRKVRRRRDAILMVA